MHLPARKTFLALGAAGLLALGAAGAVMAQDPGSSGDGAAGERQGLRHRAGVIVGLKQIVEVSGLEGSVFREGFAEGKSVNQVLEENGLDPAAIKAEVLANLEARLAEKVAAGELDQARADEILANAAEHLDRRRRRGRARDAEQRAGVLRPAEQPRRGDRRRIDPGVAGAVHLPRHVDEHRVGRQVAHEAVLEAQRAQVSGRFAAQGLGWAQGVGLSSSPI